MNPISVIKEVRWQSRQGYWEKTEKTMKKDDEGIQRVRDVRKRISAEFGNDPEKLVEHYMMEQERYRDRMVQPITAQQRGVAAVRPVDR